MFISPISASRGSFTNRSCRVQLTRSARPLADGLPANGDAVVLLQCLGSQGRTEVSVALPDQFNGVVADASLKLQILRTHHYQAHAFSDISTWQR